VLCKADYLSKSNLSCSMDGSRKSFDFFGSNKKHRKFFRAGKSEPVAINKGQSGVHEHTLQEQAQRHHRQENIDQERATAEHSVEREL
jgi:hypothetical protein